MSRTHRFPPLGPDDPSSLGPYEVVAVLGAGGMGRVYLGRLRTASGGFTPVAVQVLLPELAHEEELVRRFAREAHAATRVRSGRVARVLAHGGGNGAGQPWIATEFLAGPTLADAVTRHGPFDAPAVRALGTAPFGAGGRPWASFPGSGRSRATAGLGRARPGGRVRARDASSRRRLGLGRAPACRGVARRRGRVGGAGRRGRCSAAPRAAVGGRWCGAPRRGGRVGIVRPRAGGPEGR